MISNALHGLDTVPHNLELGFLAELGLPGLVLALAWIFTLGRSAWRVGSAARAPAERAMGLGLWAAWLAFVLHNQMESTIYGEQFKLLLMLAAAATWRLEVAVARSGAPSRGALDRVSRERAPEPLSAPEIGSPPCILQRRS